MSDFIFLALFENEAQRSVVGGIGFCFAVAISFCSDVGAGY